MNPSVYTAEPEPDQVIAEAMIGDEARKFLDSDLGRCMVGLAEQDAETALRSLASVDPNDPKAIVRLQNRAALGHLFKDYIAELFSRGEQALVVWQEEHSQRRSQ